MYNVHAPAFQEERVQKQEQKREEEKKAMSMKRFSTFFFPPPSQSIFLIFILYNCSNIPNGKKCHQTEKRLKIDVDPQHLTVQTLARNSGLKIEKILCIGKIPGIAKSFCNE
jgi:hypothetical protein